MSNKNEDPVDAVPAVNAADAVTLEEFCTRASKNDKRVELIGAFFSTEKESGSIKDAESAYAGRLAAFANKPV